MAGLTFDDDEDAVDPTTILAPLLVEWIDVLAANSTRRTVDSYVSDAAVVTAALCNVLDRTLPDTIGDRQALRNFDGYPKKWLPSGAQTPAAAATSDLAVPPVAFARAWLAADQLVLADLHPRKLGRAFDALGATHAASSRARAQAAWTNFCAFLVRRGLLAANPMAHPAVERPRVPRDLPKPLTTAETNRLLQTVDTFDDRARQPWPERDVALAVTFLATGVRVSEARDAKVSDVLRFDDTADTAAGEPANGARLRVTGKGRKTRVVPMYPEVETVMDAYLLSRRQLLGPFTDPEPLFVRTDGTAFSVRAMRSLVERWFLRAAVTRKPGACVHALRHTFATLALDSGTSIVELQTLLGHAALNTTQRYLDVVGSGLDDAVRAHTTRAMVRNLSAARP